MPVIFVTDDFKDRWNNFLNAHAFDGGLLQSWEWGELQKSQDNKVYRLGLLDGRGHFRAIMTLVRHELAFEYNYLYAPRGPVADDVNDKSIKTLLEQVKKIAAEEKSFMIRIDPAWPVSPAGSEQQLHDAGFRRSEYETQPKCNFLLDITPSAEVILQGMKPKTRYNINVAQRHGVTIRTSTDFLEMETFWQLLKQTAKRDNFASHHKEHYLKMFQMMSKENMMKLFLAEYNNKVVAACMVSFFGPVATYLHGASADLYREAMAPYLLHWQAIVEAKNNGCSLYDFGGVNGKTFHNDTWEGITRFKTNFAPATPPVEYIGSFETILNPVIFAAYKFFKQIRS